MNSVIVFEVFQEQDGDLITKCLTEDICSRSRYSFLPHPRKSRPAISSTCRNDFCGWIIGKGSAIGQKLSRMEINT